MRYETNHSGSTEILVKNLLGKDVEFIDNGFEVSGIHSKEITVGDLPDGIYLLEIKSEGKGRLKKFIKN